MILFCTKRNSFYKGMGIVSLFVTLMLFSSLFLLINTWTSLQRKSAVDIYQRFQAVQIAENQKQRLFLGLVCQADQIQNGIKFQIRCYGDTVNVRYPRGEINL